MPTSKRSRADSFPNVGASSTSTDIEPRKRNARVEIPAGRTVRTIDGLIAGAKADDALKELKIQKRLLRNREAA